MKNKSFRGIGFYVIVLIILIGTIAVMYNSAGNSGPKYSEILDFFYNEQVEAFILDGDTLQMQLKDGAIVNYLVPDWNLFSLI